VSLILQLRRLSPELISDLRHHFRNSPTTTLLIEFFLSRKKDVYQVQEAVKFVYGATANNPKYATFENRFYKLRKKIEDYLNAKTTHSNSIFSEDENALFEAKALLADSKYMEALNKLEQLDKNCKQRNLFEIWPEVLDSLIQANQALNKITENGAMHQKFGESLRLYADLMEAKNLTRRIYEINYKEGALAAEPLFLRLAKLDRKNHEYPRFKLIYNFVAGYYKVGSGDSMYQDKTNVTNRHIGVAKKIMRQHPEMPAILHTSIGQLVQRYRLIELQAMVYYNAMRFKDAAMEIGHLYTLIMQQPSAKGQMKNEVLFTNVMHMQVAAKNFNEALQTAKDYLNFLLSNNRYEKTLYAYAEIANIHVTMFPLLSSHNSHFLLEQVNEYIANNIKTEQTGISHHVLLLKAKLLITQHNFKEALKPLEMIDLEQLPDRAQAIESYKELALLAIEREGPNKQKQLQALKEKGNKMKLQSNNPADFLNWRWIEEMASYFQHK
jgi:hypothetical protein